MAGEFTKRVVDNANVWTCVVCNEEIVNQTKPRGHVCQEHSLRREPSTTSTPRQPGPGFRSVPSSPFPPFSAPPPGFNVPPPDASRQGQTDMNALFRFQQLQAEQTKQMMIFMQQQNQEIQQQMQQQSQEMLRVQKEETELKINQMMEMMTIQKKNETKVKCPRWEKDENVKNFLSRLKRWNGVEKGKGKYLQLLESLSESGRKNEKERIELEEHNGLINPEHENIINDISEKLNTWFGKTKVDEASDAWRTFKDIKRASGENVDKFLLKYETAESKLINSAVELPKLILAIQLLEAANVDINQRRNILVHVKFENQETVYDDMKSSLRLFKGALVERTEEEELPTEKLNHEDVNFNRNYSMRQSRTRSKSKPRFESRSFERNDQQRSHSKGRSGERGRSRENKQRGRSREVRDNRDNSWYRRNSYDRNREYSTDRGRKRRDYSRDRYHREKGNDVSYESINLVYKEEEANLESKETFDKMIVDCGTTKTVAGRSWMESYIETLSDEEKENIKKEPEERFFRFGNSVRYPSTEELKIPLKLGKLETNLYVSVVEASIPLLLGKPDLKRFGFTINFEEETVFISKTFEIFALETTLGGHLALPIKEEEPLDESIFILTECEFKEKEKKIKKIHQVLAHPKPEILKNFFKNSSENDKETFNVVDEVHEKCEICRKFQKSPSRPKVGLPVSFDFNECVALDLKERKTNKEYILYCICTFSRLTRGVIIKNKNPDTIVKGILDCWVLGKGIGPGIPGKFLFDNGGEFNNHKVIDLAEKHGIKMHGTTAAHSPFSNGLCEKNHEIVDRMMAKMMADDKLLKPVDALEHALFAKNVEPNNKGFSSFQIVYGNNPSIPGVTNSTPPSLNTEFTSKHVREHIGNIHKAREAFRVADNDERIKRALRSRIASYTNEQFQTDDRVYFKEKDKMQWSGPAVVIGQQGKIIFLKYGNMIRRVHLSRVIRVGNEYKKDKSIEPDKFEDSKEETKEKEQTPPVDVDDDVAQTDETEIPVERSRRKTTIRRPDKSRRIVFKAFGSKEGWKNALVTDIGKKAGTNQFKCSLLLDNSDTLIVDFSEQKFEWEYEKFPCDQCAKQFDTKRSLKMHIVKTHKTSQNLVKKQVTYAKEEVNFNDIERYDCQHCAKQFKMSDDLKSHMKTCHREKEMKDMRKLKVRFKEVMDERRNNEKWIDINNKINIENVHYAEIKETNENSEKVKEAKAKELSNFDEYQAFEEVKEDGQQILGTRFVLTEKPDGRIKARFVTKGFQEQFIHPSDSPTSSRETIKIFLAIAANENWPVESSDVRSAFLQSDNIDREVFVQPPPERSKPGIIWKLVKPCYGLDDASRKWFLSFKSTLLDLGMKQSKRESCLFYYHKDGKLEGFLIVHVDDVLSAGSEKFNKVIQKLRSKYTFGTIEKGAFVYTGLNIHQDENMKITVDQKDFVEKLTANNYPNDAPDKLLRKDENRMIRKTQGQLSWLSTQTRPDISFDSFQLSTRLNRATQKDGKNANKIIKKVKQENVELKFERLGNIEDLHIEFFADASLGNVEDGIQTKSGMGYFICLANKSLQISPLHWKSCVIDKVTEDVKTAETLALEKALDDAIHISNLVTEVYTGKPSMNSLPIVANEDSKSLLESIYSTKKVKRKTMRVVISSIQQHLQDKTLTEIHHVKSKDNIADVFTKNGVNTYRMLNVLNTNSLLHRNKIYSDDTIPDQGDS